MAARPRNPTPEKRWHKYAGQWYVKLDGVFHYLGKDEAKAEERRRRLVAERLLLGAPLPRSSPLATVSVAEAINVYDIHIAAKQAPREYARTRRAVEAVMELFGSVAANVFDQLSLQAVRAHLLQEESRRAKKVRAHLSRRYVNHLIKCIQQAWTWLESQKLVPNGSAAALRTVKALRIGDGGKETPMVLAVAGPVVEATLPFLSPVIQAMVAVQQLTGARPGELVIMRPCDFAKMPEDRLRIAFADGSRITVSGLLVGDVPVWVYAPSTYKTRYKGKYRLIAVGPKAQAILEPFLQRDREAYLFSPREAMDALRESKQQEKKYAPKRTPGVRYTVQSYGKAIGQAIHRANNAVKEANAESDCPVNPADLDFLPQWRPNQLRHAAGTEAQEQSDRDTASAVLGHGSIDTTAIYAEQAIRKAANLIARIG